MHLNDYTKIMESTKFPSELAELIGSFVITTHPLNLYTLSQWDRQKAFEIASKNDNVKLMSLLNIDGTNVDEFDIKLLAKHGALNCLDRLSDVNDFTEEDNELMELATQNGHFEVVKYISQYNHLCSHLLSLMDAINYNEYKIFMFVLERILELIDFRNVASYDKIIEPDALIEYAAESGYKFLEQLLKYIDPSHIHNGALLSAAYGGDVECLKAIMPHTDITYEEYMVLGQAAIKDNLKCLEYLLPLITDYEIRQLALLEAAETDALDCLKRLLPLVPDEDSHKRALIWAARSDAIKCLNHLIPLVDVDELDEVLEEAVESDAVESIKILAPLVLYEVIDAMPDLA